MWRLLVHLAAVGIGVAQDVTGKLDDNHLHAEADAEGRDVVCAGVVGSHNLTLNASLSEARADDHAVLSCQLLCHVVVGEMLRVDERDVHLMVVVGAGM